MTVINIANKLKEHGFKTWVVGGSVRDHFMNRIPNDWDLCTDAKPLEVMRIFPETIPTGLEYGTVTILTDDGNFEITTLRKEGKYSDGRRPNEVIYTDNIEEDLARRDFTCNAIAHDPLTNEFIDPFNGKNDIRDHILRCVGDPETRFLEDGLRVLRGCRFISTLEFIPEYNTLLAMKLENVHEVFSKVAKERVRVELIKIMGANYPSYAFSFLLDTGILNLVIPEILDTVGCKQNKWHAHDVWNHTLLCLDKCPKDPIIRMAALLHDIGKPSTKNWDDKRNDFTFIDHEDLSAEMAEPILRRLKFSNDEIKKICHLIRHHLILYNSSWSDAAIRRWIKKVGKENIDDVFTLAKADALAKGKAKKYLGIEGLNELIGRVKKELEKKPVTKPNELAINGKDVMNVCKIKSGPMVGSILKSLTEMVLDNPELNNKDTLLETAVVIHDTWPLKFKFLKEED